MRPSITHRSSAQERRGGALAASLIVAVLLAGLGAGLVQVQTAVTRRTQESLDRTRALYLAESGLAQAILALRQGRSGTIASSAEPARQGAGLLWVEREAQEDGLIRLLATGIVGRASSSVEILCDPLSNPIGRQGFFGNASVTLDANTEVLSASGTARISSSGDIRIATLRGLARVEGGVELGPRGLIEVGPDATLTGEVRTRERAFEWPTIPFPDLPTADITRVFALAEPALGPGGFACGALVLAPGQTLRLVGPLVLALTDLRTAERSTLAIDAANGPVVLHVSDTIDLGAGSTWQHLAGDASAVSLIHHGLAGPTIQCSGTFCGALLAPKTTLSLPATLTFTGSAAAERLILASGASVTQAGETADRIAGLASEPLLLAWNLADTPPADCLGQVLDPKRWLATRGVVIRPAKLAAQEQDLSIQFVDSDGSVKAWSGPSNSVPTLIVDHSIGQTWTDLVDDAGLSPAPLPSYDAPSSVTVSTSNRASTTAADASTTSGSSDGSGLATTTADARQRKPASPRGLHDERAEERRRHELSHENHGRGRPRD